MVDNCKIFASSSKVLKATAVLLGVVFIVHCVGIGTDFWVHSDHFGARVHSGLWRYCSCFTFFGETCYCVSFHSPAPGWLKGVQALEVIGLIAIIFVGLMIFMQLFFTQCTTIKIWGILLMFFSAVCILAGVTLYGAMMLHDLNFSFGLCVISSILCFVCAFLLIQDRRISLRNAQVPGQARYASQGQVIQSPPAQVVIAYSNQTQQPVYPPSYAHAQYGPPPSYPVAMQHGQFVQQQDQFQHTQQKNAE
ncbi:uncharacterized protein LOC123556391 [Mercenaria mercenaria]|uniref:uncharacterized protein LOC123556391 n=1 Tax=Mercenaria mercenaria TaxID=6596 RepID=UPI001E1DB52E|nr:uncharacterized protein LOC123556391 [Mercenaria mercenaria]